MKSHTRTLMFGVVCLHLVSSLQAAQADAPKAEKTQTFQGLEVTLLGFEETSLGSLGSCPAGLGSMQFRTSPDQPLALAKIKIKVLPSYKGVKIEDEKVTLVDADDKTYKTATTMKAFESESKEFKCALYFAVPKKPTYKSLRFDALTFPVSLFPQ